MINCISSISCLSDLSMDEQGGVPSAGCDAQCSGQGDRLGIWHRLDSIALKGFSSLSDSVLMCFYFVMA